METLNHHYRTVPPPGDGQAYRIFLRAHLRRGCQAPPEALRKDITDQVPPLEAMSYRQHVLPLLVDYQRHLERDVMLQVKAVDVEVQYHAATKQWLQSGMTRA